MEIIPFAVCDDGQLLQLGPHGARRIVSRSLHLSLKKLFVRSCQNLAVLFQLSIP